MDTLGKVFNMNFLGYAHWFISIRISQINEHSFSVNQDRYFTYVVETFGELNEGLDELEWWKLRSCGLDKEVAGDGINNSES